MPRRVLAWIRHGEYAQPAGVPSAHLPHGLTPHGQEQAAAAARVVWQFAERHGLELDPVIDCSRLRRAWETAESMARGLEILGGPRLVVKEFDALMERSLGSAANLTIEQIEAALAADPRHRRPAPGWKRDAHYTLPLPGAESLAHAGERVARHVRERMRALEHGALRSLSMRGSLTLFVGHGGAFRHAASELGLLAAADVRRLTMPHASPIYFEFSGGAGAAGEGWVRVAGDWCERAAAAPVD